MTTVSAVEARARFSDLLNRIARGEKITVTKYGAPLAIPVPTVQEESELSHTEIVEGMRALRKLVKPGKMSARKMVAEGRRI
jgi:prevent-host-death family protein